MIKNIIKVLSKGSKCGFDLVEQENRQLSFYTALSSEYQRFLVVVEVTNLMKPRDLNQLVFQYTPSVLKEDPAFSKNTDVVVLFKIDDFNEIVNFENEIFSIEEDSYSFKKHVLYYTNSELSYLNELNVKEIHDVLKDQKEFNKYKLSPSSESKYGLISRIFIKLPFLTIPVDESELDDPCLLADNNLKKIGLLGLCDEFERQLTRDSNTIIKEYIDGKMANS